MTTDTYSGPRPQLHAAVTTLQSVLFPRWWLGEETTADERTEALATFRAVLADMPDADAARTAMAFDSWAIVNRARSSTDYSIFLSEALARLAADAHQLQPGEPTAWCADCGRRRLVVDESHESTMTPRGEMGYNTQALLCGHSNDQETGIEAEAPGAPYPGPQVVVAASTSTRDMRHAREAQAVYDLRMENP